MNLDKSSLTISSDEMRSLSIDNEDIQSYSLSVNSDPHMLTYDAHRSVASDPHILIYDVHRNHLLIDLDTKERKMYLNSELVESLTASEYGKAVAESIIELLKSAGLHVKEVHDE